MRRLIVVYNPNSSQYFQVKKDILSRLTDIEGFMVGKFAIEKTNFEANVARLIKVLKDDDLILAAGGDATAAVAANAILDSKKDAHLTVLPYGNFNDLARTLKTKKLEDVLEIDRAGDGLGRVPAEHPKGGAAGGKSPAGPARNSLLYPLDIIVDGQHWRYATCYVTIGMTAEAVSIYNQPKMRQKLKKSFGRKISSYTELMNWYFKNRHRHIFLPDFKLNGKQQPKKTSDYAAVNGRSMARVMKGREDYKKPRTFRSETERTVSFPKLFMLMTKSIFYRVPGKDTKGDTLEFLEPATVMLQAEGESQVFNNVKKIEIKKGDRCLKVIEN